MSPENEQSFRKHTKRARQIPVLSGFVSLVFAVALPWADPSRFSVTTAARGISLSTLIMLLLPATVAVDVVRGRVSRHVLRHLTLPGLVLSTLLASTFVGALIGVLVFERPVSFELLYRFAAFISNALLFVSLVCVLVSTNEHSTRFVLALIWSSVVPIVLALLSPTTAGPLFEIGEAFGGVRLRGFYDDAGYFGLHTVIVLGLSLGILLYSNRRSHVAIGLVASALGVLGVIWTGSRASWLAATCSIGLASLLAILHKSAFRRLLLVSISGLLLLVFFVSTRPVLDISEIWYRLANPLAGQTRQIVEWPYYVGQVFANPLGYGPAYWEVFTTPLGSYAVQTHNVVLEALLSGGFGAAVLLILSGALLLRRLFLRVLRSRSPVHVGVLLAMVGAVVTSMFLDVLGNRMITTLAALAYGTTRAGRRQEVRNQCASA